MFLFFLLLAVALAIPITMYMREQTRVSEMSPEDQRAYHEMQAKRLHEANQIAAHGITNPTMICPHCAATGRVRTKAVTRKKGLSGGKATAALLTGGTSMLVTGLSRKEGATRAHCDACGNAWDF